MKGASHTPEFHKMNPNGKVPTLDDNGTYVWESAAIMGYLSDKKPEKGLYPTGAKERAEVNQWLHFNSCNFEPHTGVLTWENLVKPAFLQQQTDAEAVAKANEGFAKFAAVLNGALEGKEFIANNKFSIADIAIASALMYRQPAKMDTKAFPHLERWAQRVESRPTWAKCAPKM
jgi:glutathione S-transferase